MLLRSASEDIISGGQSQGRRANFTIGAMNAKVFDMLSSAIYNNKISVLSGDYLLALALEQSVETNNLTIVQKVCSGIRISSLYYKLKPHKLDVHIFLQYRVKPLKPAADKGVYLKLPAYQVGGRDHRNTFITARHVIIPNTAELFGII